MSDGAPPQTTLANGRYKLLHLLGAGGTATVWKSRDVALGVDRAIKLLEVVPEARESLQRRLQQEARIMAQLAHPNVLRVVDVGTEGARDYVVMELAKGSLQALLERSGPLRPADALRYVVQVLSALDAAHRAGVVHRDVKPHNVLLGGDGVALLADFGIARLDGDETQRRTRQGVAMGSLAYMPPEQRLDARSVGPEADVYATGATLYALATGGNPVDLFVADESSPRWDRLPVDLAKIVRRATRHAPGDRYPSARDMAADCIAALQARESQPEPEAPIASVRATFEAVTAFEDGAITGVRTPTVGGTVTMAPAAKPAPWPGSEAPKADDRPMWTPAGGSLSEGHSDVPIGHPPGGRALQAAAIGLVAMGVVLLLLLLIQGLDSPELPATAAVPVEIEAIVPAYQPVAAEIVEVAAVEDPPAEAPIAAAVVAKPKPARKAPDGPPPLGRWEGAFDGRPAELVLDGSPSALVGTMTVRFGRNAVPTEVAGTFDGGALLLEDQIDAADGGVYRGILANGALEGTFAARSGRVVPFKLKRAP